MPNKAPCQFLNLCGQPFACFLTENKQKVGRKGVAVSDKRK
jgi:hypothetical protein